MIYDQQEFDIRLEWGSKGVEVLAPVSDVVIIVDIFSFSTSVDIATARGAIIYPFDPIDPIDPKNNSGLEYSKSVNATLAEKASKFYTGYSLSPSSLINITANTRLVLQSQNGAAMSLLTGNTLTICGCLRNSKAVAEYAMSKGNKISVIPGGERWKDDNTLRPSFEDLLGAGSIISYLKGTISPESKSALSVYNSCKDNLFNEVSQCSSGKELIESGRLASDVELACEINISSCVPVLINKAYIDVSKGKNN